MRLLLLLSALLLACTSATTRAGASATMLGGYKEHKDHQNDARVQEAAKFAVAEVSKSGEKLDLLKVLTAHTQVVAGTNYQLLLLVADSGNKEKHVEATVYEPLGGADKQLTKHSFPDKAQVQCKREMSEEASTGSTLGSAVPVSTDSAEVQEAAAFAVQALSGQLNSLAPPTLKKVLQAHSTVQNGLTYNLALQLSLGPSGEKLYDVSVNRDLKKTYKLLSATQQQ